ncbi:hypothetical protein CHS0354_014752 [Potamilus streckersoni]|uniref:Uncharacterized protein n=1 Tax=Potamilus streckersoni TaxID=2493646 RepID=A0AAE0SPQ7_9BIVA|nr:hypothetical protein CHS0354_014752 [Potamilus streckersoni]
MKLNLRYNLPNVDGHSLPCLLTPKSADEQLIASEELWRDRSGSTSSWTEEDVHGRNASEKRQSFAAKSYSFGDLVHAISTESDEVQRKKFRKVERSSTVLVWQRKNTSCGVTLTLSPNNFFKNSLQVYVRHKEI